MKKIALAVLAVFSLCAADCGGSTATDAGTSSDAGTSGDAGM